MKRLVLLAVVVPLLMAPGCPEHKFEVVMQTTLDGEVRRDLTVWTLEDNKVHKPSEEVVAAAVAAYGAPGEWYDSKARFFGPVEHDLPADLIHSGARNYGFVSVTSSQMGSVRVYVEQMPGEADLRALFQLGQEIADALARILDAGLSEQLKPAVEPERLARLSTFLKTEFRDDVFSTLLIGWQAVVRGSSIEDLRGKAYEALPGEETRRETFWMGEIARFAAFAVQRGYLERGVLLDGDAWREALVRGFVRKAAVAMGYAADSSLPRELTALYDPETLNAVYQSGLKSSGMNEEEFNALLEPALPDLFGGGTNGEVFWRCDTEPIITNGDYNSENGAVRWYAVGRKGCAPPQMLFAVWAKPNEEFQREHFGKCVLAGEHLAKYASWREGLSTEERILWDDFVAALRPGDDLAPKLTAFRFGSLTAGQTNRAQTQPRADGSGKVVPGARLILMALGVFHS